MRIEKDNIIIRSANLDDAPLLNKWWNDGKVMAHAGFPEGLGQSLEDTLKVINHWKETSGELCIIEVDGKAIGELNFKLKDDGVAYPGWKICDFDYQNQGYGTKIIKLLLKFLFTDEKINKNLPIEKVIWDTMIENKRAQYVYEFKIKAKRIGIRKNSWQDPKGNWRSSVDYIITKEEYFKNF